MLGILCIKEMNSATTSIKQPSTWLTYLHSVVSTNKENKLIFYLALLGIAVNLSLIIFYTVAGIHYNILNNLLFIALGVLTIILLLKGFTTFSKICFVISSWYVVSVAYSADPKYSGAELFYMVVCLTSFCVFNNRQVVIPVLFSMLCLGTYFWVKFTGFSFTERAALSEESLEVIYSIRFTISTLTLILITYFQSRVHHQSEKKLYQSRADLQQTTNELESTKRKLELAIKGSSAGIWDWDLIENELFVSAQLKRMLGYSGIDRNGITYNEFIEYIHQEDIHMVKRMLSRHLYFNQKFHLEIRLKCKDDSYLWVLNTGQAEWDENGKPVRIVGSIVDITQRKYAEHLLQEKNQILRKVNNELDKFVYSASHDLKAPVSSLLGLIRLVEISDDRQEVKNCLEMMKSRIKVMNRVIAEIVSYSRNNRLDVKPQTVDLNHVLDRIIHNLNLNEKEKNIRFERIAFDEFYVDVDPERMESILMNIISNAVKYHDFSKSDPFVRIEGRKDNHNFCISIQDNGQGINDDVQEKIFDMFYRASEQSDGSGLGLYITKEMVEKLNGSIRLTSEIGKGSRFDLVFPNQ